MMSSNSILLSTSYFPNIQYFSKILGAKKILIENDETFPKQTFRNRCEIMCANGVLTLIVPVLNGRSGKTKTKDIKISYVERWQKQHLQSIKSAYASSPFFEFFIDEINPFFEKKYKFLIDFNAEIFNVLCELLSLDINTDFTENFVKIDKNNSNDFRFLLSPKVKFDDQNFSPQKYIQVFSDRMDFIPNLSILDLLFNVGQESRANLKNSVNIQY